MNVKYFKPQGLQGPYVDVNGRLDTKGHEHIRPSIGALAYENNQALEVNLETNRVRRVPIDQYDIYMKKEPAVQKEADPVLNFIHQEAVGLRPDVLVMPDLKWKYLVRSAVRGKNIMMTGPAGSGKTMAVHKLVEALERPFFYFNLGATQDPRGTLIGNTHFSKEEGTFFSQSTFVKAIQTENSIILLDELSRAHPEAWNILMTVLDEGQRYLRLDEDPDGKTIEVAKGVSFVATANIGNEYTATRAMDRALVDRFIIVEMETLNKEQEEGLLMRLFDGLDNEAASNIAEIAHATRKECASSAPRLTNAISTRLSVEMAGLVQDGFTLGEAAEVCVYPFFDADGGLDSERTFIKQVVQKFCGDSTDNDIFNLGDDAAEA